MAELTKTIVSYSDLQSIILPAIKSYIDKEVESANGDASAVAAKVNTLIGSVAGDDAKSVRTISAEEVAKIVNETDNGKIDTLKEIADWIVNDTTGAAKMANDIATLMGADTVVGSVAKALKDAKAYTDAEQTRAEGKEGELTTAISNEVARADAAEKANAQAIATEKERAEGVEGGLASRIETLEGKFTGEGSVDGKIATAKAEAIKDSKDYTDELLGSGFSKTATVASAISTAQSNAEAHADTVAGTAETNANAHADGIKSELEAKYGDWATADQINALKALFPVSE